MAYYRTPLPAQPQLSTRHDFIREARRLTAAGMDPRAIARQLDLTYVGVIELLLDDVTLTRAP